VNDCFREKAPIERAATGTSVSETEVPVFNLNKREFPHLYRRRDESLYLAGIGTVLVE
jgi:hypothetical protein